MIYPEDDETFFATNHYSFNYPFNVNSLKTHSPTLPLHFDKKYLPSTEPFIQKIYVKKNS